MFSRERVKHLLSAAIDQVIALYTYHAQQKSDLGFLKGSVINIISKDDPNWWIGEQNGQQGSFPSNYVGPLRSASANQL